MTALDTDDLALITGPLTYLNGTRFLSARLLPGEMVRIEEAEDEEGDVVAYGFTSGVEAYISASSLTPLSEIHAISGADGFERATAPLQQDPEVLWGETPYVVFSDIHDYVYEGDE